MNGYGRTLVDERGWMDGIGRLDIDEHWTEANGCQMKGDGRRTKGDEHRMKVDGRRMEL
jgi:hypothetical protein